MGQAKILWEGGIVVRDRGTAICFDPQSQHVQCDAFFISHAHGDHTAGLAAKSTKKFCHPVTAAIYEAVSGRTPINLQQLKYGQSAQIGDFKIRTHDSGHIPGSALFEVESNEETIVYTGDINCVDTVLTRAAERVPCDTLVLESTYGRPDLSFPSRHEVYKKLVEWVIDKLRRGKTPAFYVYAVGKAQEIIKALNDFTQAPIVAHDKIVRVNKACASQGFVLNTREPGHSPEEACVLVNPNHELPTNASDGQIPVIATGWATKFRYKQTAFPLSNHADFYQLIQYVAAVRPKRVFTCLGFAEELARHIKIKLGIEAKPLTASVQSNLLLNL